MDKYFKRRLPLALLLAGSMWFYIQFVLIAHQKADAALRGTPRGNLSDLYPRWLGARELLLHGRDPYSAELTREIQIGYYGRALDPARPEDPKDQQGFAYPVYVVFLLAPSVDFPFTAVQTGFRWLLVLLTIVSVLLWLRMLHWRPLPATTAIVVVLTLGSFPLLQGIKLQQLSLLVGGLIAVCAALLGSGRLLPAGAVLAIATIKPQLVLLVAAWLLLWSVSDWARRRNFVWGFAVTMVVLLGASQYVLPGWLGRFREAVAAYRQYNDGAESLLDVLFTPLGGRALAAIILLALSLLCWRLRRVSVDSVTFRWLLVLILAVTVVIVPKAAPYNQVLLLPGTLFVLQHWETLWARSRLTRVIAVISGALVVWPWLAALLLSIAWLLLPVQFARSAWALPIYTSLTIPIAVTVVLASCITDVDDRQQKSS